MIEPGSGELWRTVECLDDETDEEAGDSWPNINAQKRQKAAHAITIRRRMNGCYRIALRLKAAWLKGRGVQPRRLIALRL